MIKKALTIIAAAAAGIMTLAAQPTLKMTPQAIRIDTYEAMVSVGLVIVKPEVLPDALDASLFTVRTMDVDRTVTGVYRCNERGEYNPNGAYLGLSLGMGRGGSPMAYNGKVNLNEWAEAYPVKVGLKQGKTIKAGGVKYSAIDCESADMMPGFISECDVMTKGSYTGPLTGMPENGTLMTAAYEPWTLKQDGVKNPLIIWLHGMGEGGTDVRIVLMGNETIALTRSEIQSHFTSEGGANGAYVLAIQCPTMWMDSGAGMTQGEVPSKYADLLKATIDDYLVKNPDVDPDRVYVGGCSNGGYMTVSLLLRHPKFFAAGYPVCECYADKNINDYQLAALAKENVWFVQAANDTTVKPADYMVATYRRLMEIGAENCWVSLFENVMGSDIPGARYMGHFSWVYVFNDQVTAAQVQSTDDLIPSNNGGGSVAPQGYSNLFEWMNAQRR